jgi:hypothetical protein
MKQPPAGAPSTTIKLQRGKMKFISTLIIAAVLAFPAFAADLVITSLTVNGQLTWTNSISNANYRVEWASSAAGPWQSFNALTNLDSIAASNTTMTVSVPMFYRVVWTDPPAPQPAGIWSFNGYSSSGSLVATGLVTVAGSGPATGSWTLGPVPDGTNAPALTCTNGDIAGDLVDRTLSLHLLGCGFAEGAYYLSGTIVGDDYAGTWYSEGIVLTRVGSFRARRQHN